ncbi:MAG: HlyD family efflux transporter periplasmic adaptor subunit [Oscillospiraceae bacterium]|nr:HlyD family efflux transporter periplasmic adaptor subunit [Oscillospiraceae bacterium]
MANETAQIERAAPAKAPKKKNKKLRKRIIRIAIILIILAALAFGAYKLFGKKADPTSEVITDTVSIGSITQTVEGSGITKAKNSESISVTTAGTVLEVFVSEGDKVTAGQQMFSIDSPSARTAVKNAQSTLEGYQKQLSALQKDIAGLNLSATFAGKLLETEKLNEGDTISKGTKVATLVDDTKLRLKQYFSYAYEGDIRQGQTASVSIPAMMTSVTGTVESVKMVSRVTSEGSQLFEADIVMNNPGTLTADMVATASLTVDGAAVYPYESGKLEYYRTADLSSTVSGTVLSTSLTDYLNVTAGQVLVRIDGEDSENEIFTLQQSLDTAQEDLEKAQKNLDNMNALAPIDGTVIGLSIAPGDELTGTATTVINIADTSTMIIDATVDERNISYVKAGMTVDLDQWGTPFMGNVDSVSLSSTINNGVAAYPMVISVDNMDGTMMSGSNVSYSLIASQSADCLVVPVQSVKGVTLMDGSNADVVFVQGEKPDNAVELMQTPDGIPDGYWPVPVETGLSDNNNVEIRSGVEEGTTVFTQVQTLSSWG